MKKLSFLISTLALTTLVGCGGGQKPTENKCYTSVYCNVGCYLGNNPDLTKAENVEVTPNEEISFKITVKSDYELHLSDFTVTVNDQSVTTGYTYAPDVTGGTFKVEKFNVHDKLKILIKPESKKKTQYLRANCNPYCRMYNEDWTTTREIIKDVPTGQDFVVDLFVDQEEGYALTKNNITVLVGGKVQSETAYFYDSYTRHFVLYGEYVQSNVQILFEARQVTPPVEKYSYVNYNIDNITRIEAPTQVKNGDSLYATFKANEKYRLPNLDVKGDKFEIRINSRLLSNTTDYIYIIDEDSIGHVFIFSEVIDDTVNISGDCVEQLNILLSPGDGKWEKTQESSTKITTIDKGKTLNDALKAVDCGSPISNKKDQGYNFDKWLDEKGEEVFTAVPLEKDTSVTASYALKKCITYFDSFKNIDLNETRKSIKESYDYHSEIKGNLVAKSGFYLPTSIKIEVKENGEYKEITGYTYDPYNEQAENNLVIPSNLVTGDLKISGTCYQGYVVTFNPGDGVWDTTTKSKETKTGYAIAGQTVKDAMTIAGITEDKMPVTEDGKVFDAWYVGGVRIELSTQITENADLVAHYVQNTFETDTWANVSNYANYVDGDGNHKGLEKLKEVYKPVFDTFIGMERKITIGEDTFTARIIGENQDVYMENGKEVKAALTFEFTEVIEIRQYDDREHSIDNNNCFEESSIRKYLNDELPTKILNKTSGIDFKTVNKKTLHGGTDEQTFATITTTEEKMFMLSGSEIGIQKTELPEEGAVPTHAYDYDEGEAYLYYQVYSDPSYRVKKYTTTEEQVDKQYWLRTPHAVSYSMKQDKSNVYAIKSNGRYNRFMCDDGTTGKPGLVPAFAI